MQLQRAGGALVAVLVALACCGSVYAHAPGAVPATLDIPTIGAHARVVPLGEDEDGEMQAPADPDTVGWYELGTGIGTPGNALLDGHVDWGGRLRVFGRLNQLVPGDTIQIANTDGNVFTYSVTWTRLYLADDAPLDEIFARTDDENVTLITCGGTFDQTTRMYQSRWVVRAARSVPSVD
ncbi:MAG: class F sortase [Chloroflexi bacterium]|nr:class F sortase [Chloroflexota bacterium]